MKCEVSQTNDVDNPGNSSISRFYDITHETVTDFDILRKCSILFFISFICIKGFKLTSHKIS